MRVNISMGLSDLLIEVYIAFRCTGEENTKPTNFDQFYENII